MRALFARVPRALRWAAAGWIVAAVVILLPVSRRALVEGNTARGAAAAAFVLLAAGGALLARRLSRLALARMLPEVLAVAAPGALLLTLAAGGVGSSGVVLAALWLAGTAWRSTPSRALVLALLSLAVLAGAEQLARGSVNLADVVFAAPMLAVGALAPMLLQGGVPGTGERGLRRRARGLHMTGDQQAIGAPGGRVLLAQGSSPAGDASSDMVTLQGYLEEARRALGADEVVAWRWSESAGEMHAVAWSNSDGEALRFPAAEGAPLVQWAAREQVVVTDASRPRVIAAPVIRGERLYGALGVYAPDGVAMERGAAKEACASHARHVGALLELFETRRRALTMSARNQALLAAAESLGGSHDAATIAASAQRAALEVTGAARSAYLSWDATSEFGRVERSSDEMWAPTGLTVPAGALAALVCREGRRLVLEEVSTLPAPGSCVFGEARGARPPASLAIAPVVRDGTSVGAIVVEADEPSRIGEGEGEGIAILATIAALSLEVAERLEAASKQASTDGLTGLANRRGFDLRLEQLIAESDRYGHPLSLVLCDIDHFKRINDTHGHSAGDEVLRHVSRLLLRSVRGIDLAARYGGEELAVLLPHTGLEGAREMAERLRSRLEEQAVERGGASVSVTASFGVACYPDGVHSRGALFAAADRALYAAKAGGRNRVSCWPEAAAAL